jgi:hypothetical protein
MGDPRGHFALNSMVVACPRLPDKPFAPEMLDSQLDEASVEFLNDPEKSICRSFQKRSDGFGNSIIL